MPYDWIFNKTQTCKQEYASAGKVLLNEHILNFFESCVETDRPTDRPTKLSLDASLPKHKNQFHPQNKTDLFFSMGLVSKL